ncbi:MAG: hypothetical protein KBG28_31230 [Kofleriaceae bacterium]|nr:hypothetical protein [Kofleriaceae bacterium]
MRAQGTRPWAIDGSGDPPTVLVLVSAPILAGWAVRELDDAGARVQVARSRASAQAALVRDPEPRPDVLVIEMVGPDEVRFLTRLRREGWHGAVVALGHVPPRVRASLGIARALPAPYSAHILADTISTLAPNPRGPGRLVEGIALARTPTRPQVDPRAADPAEPEPLPPPPAFDEDEIFILDVD